jgi:hypothetical protein
MKDEAPSPKALCANLRGNAVGKGGGVPVRWEEKRPQGIGNKGDTRLLVGRRRRRKDNE